MEKGERGRSKAHLAEVWNVKEELQVRIHITGGSLVADANESGFRLAVIAPCRSPQQTAHKQPSPAQPSPAQPSQQPVSSQSAASQQPVSSQSAASQQPVSSQSAASQQPVS